MASDTPELQENTLASPGDRVQLFYGQLMALPFIGCIRSFKNLFYVSDVRKIVTNKKKYYSHLWKLEFSGHRCSPVFCPVKRARENYRETGC